MSVLPDQKCVDLAKHFLPNAEDDRVWRLALAFQEAAEELSDAPDSCQCRGGGTTMLCPLHRDPVQPTT